jgi:hypothetical protein
MASGGKRKTTMAKLNRESRLRERRLDKQARKEARRNAPPEAWLGNALDPATGEPAAPPSAEERVDAEDSAAAPSEAAADS